MSQADRIIELLGGTRTAAKIIGAPLTTVQSWRESGFIPAWRQAAVIEAARDAGVEITPTDFFQARSPVFNQTAA